ncbi:anthranilate synthase component I family protein [Phocaeicola barnesiae]|jgi:anthranilate synthase component 1|uniref:anthranilate synthase component I family protein n=1 Tax=Phocaeicola barnesiae TaxID=376804 RepID=UPI001F1744F1|nr:anthranilate synthase component I family protein [Phocaeicola barnesiae]MCF2574748.1 anthranilate synthase component I family protein [Phocaeicola barnesiae]MCF2597531.1 anthranilate synthase component I family protein [Phocaeicola barnesiae]MDM8251272.1 anthranilate synthase component I family protein [Phocaeicola barnesiae]MDM8258418.1 anthranilate synthase component I family protein [Phocaeicola barnesiae]MDM8309204.1 anthranilate synthase component I family protein [Phocaeicola barnesia
MKQYTYTTAYKTLLGDLHTPVTTYLKVRDLFPQSVLMESSDYHGVENNRSFIGLNPIASISISHGKATAKFPDGTQEVRDIDDHYRVDQAISDFLTRFQVEGEYAHYCGLYGYTTFNAVRYFEHIPVKDSISTINDAPDMLYILYKYLIVFHDFKHEMVLLEMQSDDEPSHIDEVEKAICNRNYTTFDFRAVGPTVSTLTDEEHKANIRKGIAHCLRGDVFQIVLSRRFIQRYQGDDFKLYRALRSINPSPYLFYFDFGGFRIFGSSPETHCKIEDGRATIDPIAGTTRRSGNKETDAQLTAALLADPKENAEHVMLVDLARNDLSRNCHDVKVEFYKEPQYYSHVIHLVSRVSGELNAGSNPIKTFIDTFPAGTLSGAPKVRAMQLISEYEPHNRGAYGGCIGFIGLNGTLNQAITIRTFVSRNNELWFQAGGGIVAKSNEENELQEVNNKLGALKKAITLAEQL